MKKHKGQIHLDALAVTGGAALAGVSFIDKLNAVLIPFLGVPVTVVTMAAAGAGVSFIHGDREINVKRMLKQIVGNTFLAVLAVAVVPKMFSMQWLEPGIMPAAAAMLAWMFRWGIPNTIKLMPDIAKKVFRLKEYKENSSFSEYDGYDSRREKYYNEDTKE